MRLSARGWAVTTLAALSMACHGAMQPSADPASAPPKPAQASHALDLVSAMPGGVESILVADLERLETENARLREVFVKTFLEPPRANEAKPDPMVDVFSALRAATPVTVAIGGSTFTRPATLGMGTFASRVIVLVKDDLDSLKTTLEANPSAYERVELDDVVCYRLSTRHSGILVGVGKTGPAWVAIVDRRHLVISREEADVRAIAKRLKAKAQSLARWQAMLQAVYQAPIVVFRVFDPANAQGNWQLTAQLEENAPASDCFLWRCTAQEDAQTTVRVWTKDPKDAAAMASFYFRNAQPTNVPGGLELQVPLGEQRPETRFLEALVAMGIYVFI